MPPAFFTLPPLFRRRARFPRPRLHPARRGRVRFRRPSVHGGQTRAEPFRQAEAIGRPCHVVHRSRRRLLVFPEIIDYVHYQECLRDALLCCGVRCHAFCQMPDRVHLLLTPESPAGVARAMRRVSERFAQSFNARYGGERPRWEGRHLATSVPGAARFWMLCRYIENNPVRGGLAPSAAAYYWSSHAHNAHGKAHNLISAHPLYLELADTPEGRQRAYRRMFAAAYFEAGYGVMRRAAFNGRGAGGKGAGGDGLDGDAGDDKARQLR